jgi:hypothetical protein
MKNLRTAVAGALLLGLMATGNAIAQSDPAPPPAWEQLSAQQREMLIAPVRERWNSDPAQRQRMLEHAQRWQDMSPEQRKLARKGMRRFEGMNPQQRHEARALFEHMVKLSPEQRKQLRAEWKRMSPEQRRAWVEANPPLDRPRAHSK